MASACECTPLCQHCDVPLKYVVFEYMNGPKKICSCGKEYNYEVVSSEFQEVYNRALNYVMYESSLDTLHLEWCPRFRPCILCKIPAESYHHVNTFASHGTCPRISTEVYRRVQDLWYMSDENYTSQLQWLPKEMVDDVLELLEVNKRQLCENPCVELNARYESFGMNQEDAIIIDRSFLLPEVPRRVLFADTDSVIYADS